LPNPWGKLFETFPNSKRRHLWIWSDGPNFGKTTGFALPLCKQFNAIIATGTLRYWNVTRHTECIILDDYNTPQLKWSTLNQICDGTYSFDVIYKGSIMLDKYILIVLSNNSISSLYPNMNQYLYERFNEIKL